MAKRYIVTVWVAAAVTFGLFVLMQRLIAMADVKLDEDARNRQIDFVRLRRDSATQKKERKLPQKVRPKPQPKTPQMDMPNVKSPSGQVIAIAAPDASAAVKLSGKLTLGAASADTDAVPVVRVEPTYPRVAAQRGIEGWVVMEFTISTIGTVKDARVLQAQPPGMFDRAALNAIRKWKYKPRVDNGKAYESTGHKVKLTFELGQ